MCVSKERCVDITVRAMGSMISFSGKAEILKPETERSERKGWR